MANQIRFKRASGSDPVASDLVIGEPALRTDTGELFFKKDNGTVAKVSGGGGVSDGDKGDITVSNSGDTFTIDNGVISTAKIANDAVTTDKINANAITATEISNGVITNDKINSNAAIAGTKISPNFGSQAITTTGNCNFSDVTLENAQPSLILSDNNAESDFAVQNRGGVFTVRDIDNNANRFQVASDGTTTVAANLDVGAGIDVTGDITVTGTVDGVDIAALNTTVGTKLPLAGGTLTGNLAINRNQPIISFDDTSDNPDYYIGNIDGAFKIRDTSNAADRLVVNTDGHVDVTGNLDVGAGLDVTGNITVTGTVDGRDLATDGSKLDGIESGATADQTASEILTLIKTVDGAGSGLDADTLDGISSASFLRSDANDTATGNISIRKSTPVLTLDDTNTTATEGPTINFDTDNNQGVALKHVEHDGDLPVAGYGLVLKESDANNQFPSTGTLSLTVLGNIYAGATSMGSVSRVLTTADEGSGNGLDADTLDGVQGASFLRSDANDTATGDLTLNGTTTFNSGAAGAATIGANGDIRFTNGNWTGESCKIQQHGNYLYIAGGSNGIFLRDDNSGNRWLMNSSGHFQPAVDSSFDIGANGTRVRNGYFDNLYGSGANLTSIPYSALTGTPTIPTNNNQLTNGAGYITSATNNFVSSASFNTGNGVLTLNRSGLGAVTVDLDGRFATGTIPTNNNQLSNGRGFITGSGNTTGQARFLENSRTGSAPNYALRAWVNFKGTGSVSVRASGNVSSISDFGQGNYRVNFSTSMADSNYATTTIGAYDKTNSLAPFIIFSQGGFGSNPIQYNSSGVRCGSTYGDFHIATLMFAR